MLCEAAMKMPDFRFAAIFLNKKIMRDVMKDYTFNPTTGLLGTAPASQTNTSFNFPGPTPVVSANGTANAIAWAVDTSAYTSSGPSVLHAYNANNLKTELYNTSQNAARDTPDGSAVKFSTPLVMNGKVFMGTSNAVVIYGLLSPKPGQ